MFDLPLVQVSDKARAGLRRSFRNGWRRSGLSHHPADVARQAAGRRDIGRLYITAAYWFTASTSFANPAVTLARASRTRSQAFAPMTCHYSWPRSSWALVCLDGLCGVRPATQGCDGAARPVTGGISINSDREACSQRGRPAPVSPARAGRQASARCPTCCTRLQHWCSRCRSRKGSSALFSS